MTPASAKSKGRKLQQFVRGALLAAFPSLQPDDVRSCPMGSGGEDVQLSPFARTWFDFSVECKARASLVVYRWLDEAAKRGKGEPLLVIKADRREPLAVLPFNTFMELVKSNADA